MKKFGKILFFSISAMVFLGMFFIIQAFIGNPVSKLLATFSARQYLGTQYADTDYILGKIDYSFKTKEYYARVSSPSSQDTHFSLVFSGYGKLLHDDYTTVVTSGRNTFDRINNTYFALCKDAFEDIPYLTDIAYGNLEEKRDLQLASMEKDFGLDPKTLILDTDYDIKKLGAIYGMLTVYAESEEVSVQRASELLLDMASKLEQKEVPFYAVNFVLQKPKNADGTPNQDTTGFYLTAFLHSDIYKSDLQTRMQNSHDETMAYYAEQDKVKMQEMN